MARWEVVSGVFACGGARGVRGRQVGRVGRERGFGVTGALSRGRVTTGLLKVVVLGGGP